MAGQVNARIGIQLDAAGAISQLRALQTQMSALQRSAALGTAGMAGRQKDMLNTTMQMVNGTRMFTASMVAQESAVNRFSSSLERNKLSMGQYFRYGMSQMPGMRRMFQREWDMMEATAKERVRRLNTQYMSAGQGKAIAMRPTDKAMNWSSAATGAALAAQKQQLFNKVMNDGATSLLNFGKNTQWAGRQLMVGFSIPMGIFAGVASKTFMDLERSMIQFKRVYGDLMTPVAETDAMAEQARKLGLEFTKYGIAVKDTIGVAADVAATGASGEKMLEATRQTLRLATLGQIDYQQAVVATIALQSAFGVSSKDLATSIDFMNAVENQTILSLDDITKAIPRVGPVIKGLGGDYRDLAVMMTALREGGVTAEQGANALKSGLSSLVAPTGTAIKTLKELGINITKIVKDNEDDLLGMLMAAGKAFDKLGKLDKQKGLSALFGKYQYARWGALFENISRGGSQAQRAMELAGMSAKDLASLSEKELGKMSESATFKFTAAVERIKQAIAPIGEMFLNIFTPLIDFGSKLLEKFNELPDGVKKAAVIVVSAIAGIAPVALMTFGLIANGIANIMKTALMFRRGLRRAMGKGDEGYRTMAELDAQAMMTLEKGYAGATSAANLHKDAVMALVGVYERLTTSASEAAAATSAAFGGPTGRMGMPGSVPPGTQADITTAMWNASHVSHMPSGQYNNDVVLLTQGLNTFTNKQNLTAPMEGASLAKMQALWAQAQQQGIKTMYSAPLFMQMAELSGNSRTYKGIYKDLLNDPRLRQVSDAAFDRANKSINEMMASGKMSVQQFEQTLARAIDEIIVEVEKTDQALADRVRKARAQLGATENAKGDRVKVPKGTETDDHLPVSSYKTYGEANEATIQEATKVAAARLAMSYDTAADAANAVAAAQKNVAAAAAKETAAANKLSAIQTKLATTKFTRVKDVFDYGATLGFNKAAITAKVKEGNEKTVVTAQRAAAALEALAQAALDAARADKVEAEESLEAALADQQEANRSTAAAESDLREASANERAAASEDRESAANERAAASEMLEASKVPTGRQAFFARNQGKLFGASMGLDALSMALMFSGNEGLANIGQKMLPLTMGLSMLSMFPGALAAMLSPVGIAVTSVAAALGGFAYALKVNADNFSNASDEAIRMTRTLSTTGETYSKALDYFGKTTALERWTDKQKQLNTQSKPVKLTKAEEFWASDAGKQMWSEINDAAKLKVPGFMAGQVAARKIAQMVMSGVISKDMATALVESMPGPLKLPALVELQKILGPNGEDLKKDPLEVALRISSPGAKLFQQQMNQLLPQIDFDPSIYGFGEFLFNQNPGLAEQSVARFATLSQLGLSAISATQENMAAVNLQYMRLISSAETEAEKQKYVSEMYEARAKMRGREILQEKSFLELINKAEILKQQEPIIPTSAGPQSGPIRLPGFSWGNTAMTMVSAPMGLFDYATGSRGAKQLTGVVQAVADYADQSDKMSDAYKALLDASLTEQYGEVGKVFSETVSATMFSFDQLKNANMQARLKLDVVEGQISPEVATLMSLWGTSEKIGDKTVAQVAMEIGPAPGFGKRLEAMYAMSQAQPKRYEQIQTLIKAGRSDQASAILRRYDELQKQPKLLKRVIEFALKGATEAQVVNLIQSYERFNKLPPEIQKKVNVDFKGMGQDQINRVMNDMEAHLDQLNLKGKGSAKEGQGFLADYFKVDPATIKSEFGKISKEWKTWTVGQKKNWLLEVGLKSGKIDVKDILSRLKELEADAEIPIGFKIESGWASDGAARSQLGAAWDEAVKTVEKDLKVPIVAKVTATTVDATGAEVDTPKNVRVEVKKLDAAGVTPVGYNKRLEGFKLIANKLDSSGIDKTITVRAKIVELVNTGGFIHRIGVPRSASATSRATAAHYTAPVVSSNRGGPIQLANGRWVPGPTTGPNRDSVPAILTPGEFVVTRNVAQKHRGFLEALNAGRIRMYNRGGYATGGEATDSTDTSADSGGSDSNPWADMLKSMKNDKALAEGVAKAIAAGLPWDMIAEVLSMGEDGAKMLKKLIKANGQINEDNMAKMREMLSGKATLAFQQWQAETAMALDAVVGRSRMINNKKMRGFGVRGALTLDTVNAMPDEVVAEMQRLMQIIKTGKGDVKEAKARLKELWAQAKAVGKALGEIQLREFANDMRASFRAGAGRRALTAGGLNSRIVDELSDENVNYLMELKKKNKEEYKRWMRILKGMDKRAKAEELAAERAEKLANAYEWGKSKREEIWNRRNALNNRRYAQQVGNSLIEDEKKRLSDAGLAAMSDEDLQQYVALLREAKKTGPAGARARAELERINVALNALAHIAAAEAIANAAKLKADVQYALTARGNGLTGQAIAYAQEQGMTLADIAAMSAEEIKKMNDAARDAADALQQLEWAAMTKGELGGELGSKYEELAQAYQGKADDQARLWFAANSGYGSIENAQYIIAQKQAEIAAWQRQIADIEYERIRPLEKQIKLIQQENDKLQDQIDIHNRNKELAQRAIDDITKAYDEQFEALDLIEKKEQAIAALRQSQIDLAGALSRGDIFAAASARGQMQSTFSDYARQSMRDSLERQKEEALKPFQDVVDRAEEEIERLSDIMYVNSEKMERIQEQIDAIRDNEIQTLQDAIDAKQREIDQVQAVIDQYELMRQANAAMIGEAMNNAAQARIATGYWDEVIAKLQELIRKLIDMINSLDDEDSGPTTNPGGQSPPQPQTTQGGNPVGQTPSSRVYWRNDDGTISSTTIYENRPTDRPTFPYIAWVGDTPLDTSKVPSGGYYNGYGFATGGWVKGVGNEDSVSAMLTPGEFVVNKNAAKKNARALEDMNAGKSGESSGFTNYRQSPWGQTPNPDAEEGWRNEYYWDTWNPVTGQMEPGIATVVGNSAIVWNYSTGEWVLVDAPEASEKPKRYWGVQDHINDGEWTGQDSMFWTMANQLKKLAQSNPSMSAMVDKKLRESGLAWYASISPEDYAKMNEMINSPQYIQTMMTPPQKDSTQYLYNPNTNTNVQIVIPGGANAEQVANIVMQRIGSVVDQGVRRYNR